MLLGAMMTSIFSPSISSLGAEFNVFIKIFQMNEAQRVRFHLQGKFSAAGVVS